MSNKSSRAVLKILICVLSLILAGLLGLAACGVPAAPQETTAPTTEPATEATTAPTTAPTTEATTAPTTEPTTVPTTEPQPTEYMLSFVGDCTFGNQNGKAGKTNFIGVVGDNYDWPWMNTIQYFESDDCTFINFEGVLTESNKKAAKEFVFKGPTHYNQFLTAGSVEFANVVNNHIKDYGQQGYDDTLAALDAVGVHYAEELKTVVFTTESGLTIGVYADFMPTKDAMKKLPEKIAQMRKDGAEIVVVAMHWGEEYVYKPNYTQKKFAHDCIDAGANIVWGHHPHVLQPIEEYNGGIIYYSLGNFAFGGNATPYDKDSAILQQKVIRELDGTVHLGELTIIPCNMSSKDPGNNYQPTPRDPEDEKYARTLQKLDGTYPVYQFIPSYRDDINTPETTAPAVTTPAETTPPAPAETTPPAPAETNPPAPAETNPPAPAETNPPAPAETNPPAPVETNPPAPAETTPPAPVETNPPAPPADNGGESA